MNRATVFKVIRVVFAVAWIFAVTFNYYIVHKPFTLENALAILNALGDVSVASALVAVAAALGRRILRSWTFDSILEAIVFQAGLGLGVIALGVLGLGLVGLLNSVLFWAFLLVAALLLRGDLLSLWRALRSIRLPMASRFERALVVLIALSLAIAFVFALTPPVAWDGQVHHLAEAKLQIVAGRISTPPDIPYFSFPALANMLFLAAMLLKGDVVTQLVHLAFLLLTLGATLAFAQRYFNPRVAWLAAAILVAVPSFWLIATWAYVDLALVLYSFLAFYALMIGFEKDEARWFALAGVSAGFAISVKYTAAIVPIALALLFLLRRRFDVARLFLLTATCGLVALPYYLRTWAFTGNPVYPFVFGGNYWDAFRAEWFGRFGTGLLNSPLQLLLAPWHATIYSGEGSIGFEATIGPLLLLLLPLFFFAPSHSASRLTSHASRITFYALCAFSLLLYLFWLAGVAESKLLMQTRLLFPAFPALALVAAAAYDRLAALDLPQFSIQRFARLVIALVLGLTVSSQALNLASDNALAYLAGFESREAYLTRHLDGYYAAIQFVNANLPANARVYFLWEPRSYYAERAVQPDAILDAWAHLRWQYHDVDSIAAALRERGYTHLLLSRSGLDFMLQTGNDPITLDDARALEALAARHLRQIYGKTPLETVTRNDKPAVLGAADAPYAIYEITEQAQ